MRLTRSILLKNAHSTNKKECRRRGELTSLCEALEDKALLPQVHEHGVTRHSEEVVDLSGDDAAERGQNQKADREEQQKEHKVHEEYRVGLKFASGSLLLDLRAPRALDVGFIRLDEHDHRENCDHDQEDTLVRKSDSELWAGVQSNARSDGHGGEDRRGGRGWRRGVDIAGGAGNGRGDSGFDFGFGTFEVLVEGLVEPVDEVLLGAAGTLVLVLVRHVDKLGLNKPMQQQTQEKGNKRRDLGSVLQLRSRQNQATPATEQTANRRKTEAAKTEENRSKTQTKAAPRAQPSPHLPASVQGTELSA